jgi:hypothetical protein
MIPYFTDAHKYAVSPNVKAPAKDIMANISRGDSLKIGTQLVVQTYPDLVNEVAPVDIVTGLFGEHFSPKDVTSLLGLSLLPKKGMVMQSSGWVNTSRLRETRGSTSDKTAQTKAQTPLKIE